MASQTTDASVPADAAPISLPDRSENPAEPQGESKNAAKKAAKAAKMAADKADKAAKKEKGIGKDESKKGSTKPAKKKIENAALIGIDASKSEDFPSWYQQVISRSLAWQGGSELISI